MIACDLDNVLATNRGMDTSHGEPIHRTFRSLPPQLRVIRDAGLPFHVVTAKVSRQAWQILRAVGLADQVTSVVGAEVLFWPTIWSALRRGRLPGTISKAAFTRFVPTSGARAVMIEDRIANLEVLFRAGTLDTAILVPPLRIVEERVVEWFDLDSVLRLAADLARSVADVREIERRGYSILRWTPTAVLPVGGADAADAIGRAPLIFEAPRLRAGGSERAGVDLRELDTGERLTATSADAISAVRETLRLLRGLGGARR